MRDGVRRRRARAGAAPARRRPTSRRRTTGVVRTVAVRRRRSTSSPGTGSSSSCCPRCAGSGWTDDGAGRPSRRGWPGTRVEGFALHLPLDQPPGGKVAEVVGRRRRGSAGTAWPLGTLWVSHLSDAELAAVGARAAGRTRCGRGSAPGCGSATGRHAGATATVLAVHAVARGRAVRLPPAAGAARPATWSSSPAAPRTASRCPRRAGGGLGQRAQGGRRRRPGGGRPLAVAVPGRRRAALVRRAAAHAGVDAVAAGGRARARGRQRARRRRPDDHHDLRPSVVVRLDALVGRPRRRRHGRRRQHRVGRAVEHPAGRVVRAVGTDRVAARVAACPGRSSRRPSRAPPMRRNVAPVCVHSGTCTLSGYVSPCRCHHTATKYTTSARLPDQEVAPARPGQREQRDQPQHVLRRVDLVRDGERRDDQERQLSDPRPPRRAQREHRDPQAQQRERPGRTRVLSQFDGMTQPDRSRAYQGDPKTRPGRATSCRSSAQPSGQRSATGRLTTSQATTAPSEQPRRTPASVRPAGTAGAAGRAGTAGRTSPRRRARAAPRPAPVFVGPTPAASPRSAPPASRSQLMYAVSSRPGASANSAASQGRRPAVRAIAQSRPARRPRASAR